MKNNYFIIKLLILFLLVTNVSSKDLKINSSEVKLDKKESKVILKGNIKAVDENNNLLEANEAIYLKDEDLLKSIGSTNCRINPQCSRW